MYRFARARSVLPVLLTLSLGVASHASAQSPSAEPNVSSSLSVASIPRSDPRRPRALLPLYVSFGSLQVLDAHSTARAIDNGAVETNPLMRGFAGSLPGMLAVKTAGTAGVVWAGERLWRKNKAAAVVFLVAANSAMGWVVQHNYRAMS